MRNTTHTSTLASRMPHARGARAALLALALFAAGAAGALPGSSLIASVADADRRPNHTSR